MPPFCYSVFNATQAEAALFNYEFVNVDGVVPGTVKGSITLPDGDGTFAASLVMIDSYPAMLGLVPAPKSISSFAAPYNSFVVGGGQILSSYFYGIVGGGTALSLNSPSFCGTSITYLNSGGAGDSGNSGVLDYRNSSLSFSPGAASVPGPLPLLGAAAAFAHSRRLRARLRDASPPQD